MPPFSFIDPFHRRKKARKSNREKKKKKYVKIPCEKFFDKYSTYLNNLFEQEYDISFSTSHLSLAIVHPVHDEVEKGGGRDPIGMRFIFPFTKRREKVSR